MIYQETVRGCMVFGEHTCFLITKIYQLVYFPFKFIKDIDLMLSVNYENTHFLSSSI